MSAGYDPIDLRGQDKKAREDEERARAAQKREAADLRWLMGQRQGRRAVWRLLAMARLDNLSFDTNAMQMAFKEGKRSVGLELLSKLMEVCPELFLVMQKEQQDDRDGSGTQSN